MGASGKHHALLALPRGIQPFQMEAGWTPEPDSVLEQKPRLSLPTKIETKFLVATPTIWLWIYFPVLQIGEELMQASESVCTFLCSIFGLTQEKK
jgi:hypothetical protein